MRTFARRPRRDEVRDGPEQPQRAAAARADDDEPRPLLGERVEQRPAQPALRRSKPSASAARSSGSIGRISTGEPSRSRTVIRPA
jgi:hypothetical protein